MCVGRRAHQAQEARPERVTRKPHGSRRAARCHRYRRQQRGVRVGVVGRRAASAAPLQRADALAAAAKGGATGQAQRVGARPPVGGQQLPVVIVVGACVAGVAVHGLQRAVVVVVGARAAAGLGERHAAAASLTVGSGRPARRRELREAAAAAMHKHAAAAAAKRGVAGAPHEPGRQPRQAHDAAHGRSGHRVVVRAAASEARRAGAGAICCPLPRRSLLPALVARPHGRSRGARRRSRASVVVVVVVPVEVPAHCGGRRKAAPSCGGPLMQQHPVTDGCLHPPSRGGGCERIVEAAAPRESPARAPRTRRAGGQRRVKHGAAA